MKAILVGALAMVLMGTVACSSNSFAEVEARSDITLQEARKYQNRVLSELGGYVPPEFVVGGMSAPIEQMPPMSCDWMDGAGASAEKSGVFLPGGYDLEVSLETDLDEIRDRIRNDYDDDGWEATWENRSRADSRTLQLLSPNGYSFYLSSITTKSGVRKLLMSSFSPCIKAPADFSMFEQY